MRAGRCPSKNGRRSGSCLGAFRLVIASLFCHEILFRSRSVGLEIHLSLAHDRNLIGIECGFASLLNPILEDALPVDSVRIIMA